MILYIKNNPIQYIAIAYNAKTALIKRIDCNVYRAVLISDLTKVKQSWSLCKPRQDTQS